MAKLKLDTNYLVLEESEMTRTVPPPINDLFLRPVYDEDGDIIMPSPMSWCEVLDAMRLENGDFGNIVRQQNAVDFRVIPIFNPRPWSEDSKFDKANIPAYVNVYTPEEYKLVEFDEVIEPLN